MGEGLVLIYDKSQSILSNLHRTWIDGKAAFAWGTRSVLDTQWSVFVCRICPSWDMGSSVAFHVQEIIDALVGGMNSVQESPSGQSIGSSLLLAMLLSFSQLGCLNVKPIAQGHPLALRKHSLEKRPSIKQRLDHTRSSVWICQLFRRGIDHVFCHPNVGSC